MIRALVNNCNAKVYKHTPNKLRLRIKIITVYIDIGTGSSDSATVAFDFGTTSSTSRQWDIKVAQIPCGSSYGY